MRAVQYLLIVLTAALASCLSVPPEGDEAAGGPDAGPAGGEQVGSLTCGALFGQAPEYTPCRETDSSCEFVTEDPDDADFLCRDMCGTRQCLTGYDSDNLSCDRLSEDGCDAPHESQICVCAR
jgi:hypothetical protein